MCNRNKIIRTPNKPLHVVVGNLAILDTSLWDCRFKVHIYKLWLQISGMEPTLQLQVPLLVTPIPSLHLSLSLFRSISSRSSSNRFSTHTAHMV